LKEKLLLGDTQCLNIRHLMYSALSRESRLSPKLLSEALMFVDGESVSILLRFLITIMKDCIKENYESSVYFAGVEWMEALIDSLSIFVLSGEVSSNILRSLSLATNLCKIIGTDAICIGEARGYFDDLQRTNNTSQKVFSDPAMHIVESLLL
jgi:hypothetical protein